jgi:hypothetical protein
MPPICIQTKNVNLPRTHSKIRRNRELTGGPWRGTRPSSSPAFLHTTRSTKSNTNQNAITSPTHSVAEKRTYREETLQERDLAAGGATPMDGTEETEPARAERGPVRRSSASPSLYGLSPVTAKNTGNAVDPGARGRRRAGGEATTSAVSSSSIGSTFFNPHLPRSPLCNGKITTIQRCILFYIEKCIRTVLG